MSDEEIHPERLIDPGLGDNAGISHGFFTRRGGRSSGLYASLNCGVGSGDDRSAVATNRAAVAATLGARSLVSPYQVHGAGVVVAKQSWAPEARPVADAIVTASPGIAIGIGTADCAPLLFAEPSAGIIGAAHAGWGGTLKGIVEATVAAMVELGAQAERILCSVGPAIAQRSYEVGAEFREFFIVDDPANERFFNASDRRGHYRFDLVGHILARTDRLGLKEVSAIGLDTYDDEERFFSFRRATHRGEADYGRMISAIVLR